MANGKPGDHPITDILNWKMEVYGPEADDLVRQIVQLGGREHLEAEPTNLLRLDPRFQPGVDIEGLTENLRDLRDRLRSEAIERGWEVD